MMVLKLARIFVFVLLWGAVLGQAPPENWFHSNPPNSGFNGISLDALYAKIDNIGPGKKIVVAVLDTGVDIKHEDLNHTLWINEDEIPGNGLDDDQNGYVDDIHGWNFIGNANGRNVIKDSYEVTRLYKKYKTYFAGKDIDKLRGKDKKKYKAFQEYQSVVEKERKKARKGLQKVEQSEEMVRSAIKALDAVIEDTTVIDKAFVDNFSTNGDQNLTIARQILESMLSSGMQHIKIGELMEKVDQEFARSKAYYQGKLEYGYNPDFDSREIIGDEYSNPNQRDYGNADVKGGFAFHGTHVSGIIAADRHNDLGIKGICDNARIMAVRMLPDGDERDKDVANAIRYAVDNGASVINMSFGKGHTWDKRTVDKAVKYAQKHDVLIVHAAGNSGQENTPDNNYPNDLFERRPLFGKKKAKNWIEVGALSYQPGENAIANFSNYSKTNVDLFAPGVMIYSTAPEDSYQAAQGTSMAAPVVAGVAALIRSYFPELKAVEVKKALMDGSVPIENKVTKPGTYEKVHATELSVSGGMLNAYQAFLEARKRYNIKYAKRRGKVAQSSNAAAS